MNKSDLIRAVVAHTGRNNRTALNQTQAAAAVDAIFSTSDGVIVEALRAGDRVQVTGFGTFEVRERGARTGRNPRTGEAIEIAASRNPAFRAGKSFKDAF